MAAKDRPRPIGVVNVELLETTKVKVHSDVTNKDFFGQILRSEHLYTSNSDEYSNSQVGTDGNREKNPDQVPNTPKFFVGKGDDGKPSITLIGNAIIATPETPNFENFPARLDAHDKAGLNQPTLVDYIGDHPWVDYELSSGYVVIPRLGNGLKGGGNRTGSNNAWLPANDGDGPSGFHETKDGIIKYEKQAIETAIESKFSLEKNQPFSLKFIIGDFTGEQKKVLQGKIDKVADKFSVMTPSVDVVFGGIFRLTVFQTGKIRLTKGGKRVGGDLHLSLNAENKKNGFQLSIYPLGSYIYVYSGLPTTEATIKGHYVAFKMTEPVEAGAGKLTLVFKCGAGHMNFSPIVHPTSGQLNSPVFGGGFKPDNKILNVGCLGKFGVGTRESPILFPDINDKNGIYSYLNGYSIEYLFSSVDSTTFTYTLKLKVPHDTNNIDVFAATLNTALRDIIDNFNSERDKVLNGTQSVGTAKTNTTNFIGSTTSSLGTSFNSLFSDDTGGPTTLINGMRVDLTQAVSDAWGTYLDWGGLDLTDVINNTFDFYTGPSDLIRDPFAAPVIAAGQRASNQGEKELKNQAVVQANKNIYSPAVFYTQVTLKKDLEEVSLNPNPQIENTDVMKVSISQAVESSKASILLNNRNSCGSGKPRGGKYTYIQGKNNFTGIKPIQIGVGYKGEDNDNKPQVVFTGYVTSRDYSRAHPGNSSTCTLMCEDMSKKARETFAVNLPFFDGWCLDKDSLVLTTNGLERIEDLYKSNKQFSIITNKESGYYKQIVNNCIAIYRGKKELYEIKLDNGSEVKATKDHKFLLYPTKWVSVKDLSIHDSIRVYTDLDSDLDIEYSNIVSIKKVGIDEVYDVSMPEIHAFYANGIYTHNCHLASIYYLAKQAGYADDEILVFQNPTSSKSKTKIRDLLVGDPDTFTGGCFDGHVHETPPGGAGLTGSYLHMTLPLGVLGVEEPNYNFAFGTPLWDCMMRIREFSGFYLYANHYGNIIYAPPKHAVTETGREFKEVDTVQEYNEIRRSLDVHYDTADTRNAVFLQGLTFLSNKNNPITKGTWSPHIHVRRKDNFPNDIGEPSYAPWLRYAFLRNPKWEFPGLAALATEEIFRRVTRFKFNANFEAWGQPDLFPYHIFTINEELNDETGTNKQDVIVAAHTLSVDTSNFQPISTFEVERVDREGIDYDSQLPPNIRE